MLTRTEAFRGAGTKPRPTVVGIPGVIASSFAPTYPTGISVGDLLIFTQAVVGQATSVVSTVTFSQPGGWTSAGEDSSAEGGSGRPVHTKIWTRTAGGSESGSVSGFGSTGGSGTISVAAAIIVVRGASATLDDIQHAAGQDDPVIAPSLTVGGGHRLGILVPVYGDDTGNWADFTGGIGADFTVLAQAGAGGGADRRIGVHAAGLDASASGKTESTSRTADEWLVFGLVLKPA